MQVSKRLLHLVLQTCNLKACYLWQWYVYMHELHILVGQNKNKTCICLKALYR